MTAIRLNQVNLVVRDMQASAAFYRLLGIDVPDPMPQWPDHHRNATSGDVSLDLDTEPFAAAWDAGWPGGAGVVLGFAVETREAVDELFARLTAAGHRGQQLPYDAFWGARYAVVEDPNGIAVGIMSPVDRSRSTPPPDLPA
ncbi:MAG: VOC family protein [Dehalococcoidia bacterium]|nr:VOC family protein [Dehalococcoidia bacterium]